MVSGDKTWGEILMHVLKYFSMSGCLVEAWRKLLVHIADHLPDYSTGAYWAVQAMAKCVHRESFEQLKNPREIMA